MTNTAAVATIAGVLLLEATNYFLGGEELLVVQASAFLARRKKWWLGPGCPDEPGMHGDAPPNKELDLTAMRLQTRCFPGHASGVARRRLSGPPCWIAPAAERP